MLDVSVWVCELRLSDYCSLAAHKLEDERQQEKVVEHRKRFTFLFVCAKMVISSQSNTFLLLYIDDDARIAQKLFASISECAVYAFTIYIWCALHLLTAHSLIHSPLDRIQCEYSTRYENKSIETRHLYRLEWPTITLTIHTSK